MAACNGGIFSDEFAGRTFPVQIIRRCISLVEFYTDAIYLASDATSADG